MLNSTEILKANVASSRRYNPVQGAAYHNGVDYPVVTGTPVLARYAGVIKVVGSNPPGKDFGNYIRMDYDENNLSGWYAHLQNAIVSPEQHVNQGEVIGFSNNTGQTTGPHLHYSESLKGTTTWVNPDETEVNDMIDPKYYAHGEMFKYTDDPTVYLKFTAESFKAETNDNFGAVVDIGPNPVPLLNEEINNLKNQLIAGGTPPATPTEIKPGDIDYIKLK